MRRGDIDGDGLSESYVDRAKTDAIEPKDSTD
jgi:hypothetical protein